MSNTSFSLYSNPSAWGHSTYGMSMRFFWRGPLEGGYPTGQTAPPSSDYAPDLIELEDHVPVYVLEPEEDPEEDPVDYAPDADNDKDSTVRPVPSAEETEPFETDESAATPPPPHAYHNTLRIAARIRLRAASPPLLLPSTSRRADILEANIPRQKRLLLTAPTPRFEVGRVLHLLLDSQDLLWPVGSITALWILWMPRDRTALRSEVDTLRRYLSSLCTTHEQERVEAHQALARSEAYNRALEAQITLLETQAHCHEWQCQDTDDRAIGHIMRIQKMPSRKGTKTKTTPATATATATTPMTDAAIRALIAQGVADALAERTIQRNTNLNGDGR
ncbi:hypothetical protein Tco_1273722 [Tanacetum coccineum]